MADLNTVKIVSYANLESYHGLLTQYIKDADAVVDAKSVKNVAVVGDAIYFFKQDTIPTTESGAIDTSKASAKVDIASSDVETLKEEMEEVQATLAGYSSTSTVAAGVAAAQKAAEDHADAKVKELADGAVATNTAAIATINNPETGILKQAQNYTDALANGQVKTNKESIESILDTTTGIEAVAKKYTDDEIDKVEATIGTVAEGETVVSMIADAKKAGTDAQDTIDSYKTSNDARVKAVEDDVDAIETTLGDMTAVKTTSKEVAGAIDELKDAIDSATEAGEVTLTTAETATEGYLKTYVLSQGGEEVGKIDIPKDMVVKSGSVVVDPEGQEKGTYIELIIANDEETPIYINVKNLVDIYKGAESATQVQITVDGYTISAALVAGGVGTTELANSAVTTVKIADKNVTLGKLADDVQTSLGLADSALQAADITTGSANGTIAVEGTDVAVKGLDSAAYQPTTAFDAAGDAAQALVDAKQYADDLYEIALPADITKLFED